MIIQQKLIKIGDRVIIDDKEWKVAEIKENLVTLYHENVEGSGQTILMSPAEVKDILSS
ncbi:uncharacterized protein METZ01_LOCUS240853, partial [marine metagenome]